jgi:serine/threonine protein kinase
MLGQRIRAYRIESRLGSGPLGIVYRALNEDTGETVAIKVVRDAREASPQLLWRLCRILSRFHHENIVQVMEVGRFHGATYLVMDFVPGLTLANVLAERGPLPWPEVVGLGLQICEALKHIHARGVLHRNIKPAHFILNEDHQLKLIGFGLAISVDETVFVSPGFAVGTPGYMAPEQTCGLRAISTAIDLFALGVVLWNLLTGESPCQESSESAEMRGGAALAFTRRTQSPPRPSARIRHVPKALDDLVVQLMDHAPQKRPRTAAAVASVLVGC